ncbi:periplasmic heavy metal sensor [Cognatishimia maritima]|uniref:Heavy-metal resistance n=1 Tax=Cognatishimia maritima TaxID=870908 RepID=A0A1M5UCY7_9RHOB|nr:periplasmic heavy metal sensor [Cognatishimia maritima]SHH60686.1 Heavy-metal resistance [Cognatishimia maritima]
MSANSTPPRAPMRRSLRILLFVSLALNLIVVGLAAGAIFGGSHKSHRLPRETDFMGAFTQALPDRDRREIGRDIRRHHRREGIDRAAARAEFEAMLTLIRSTPFEADDLRALLTKQARQEADRRVAAQDIWLSRVASMTDAERQDYADQIEAVLAAMAKRGPRR